MPLFLLGAALVLIGILDALWTTLWIDGGAGPIARRVITWTRRAFSTVVGRRPGILSLTGPVSITTTLTLWVLLLWMGWSVVFFAGDGAVVSGTTGEPATRFSEHVYFVSYTIFTVGYGDFVPEGAFWQVLSGVASGSGLGILTLGLTYVMTVLSAVVKQRAIASEILGVAARPQDLVLTAWNRGRFEGLSQLLGTYSTRLAVAAERRLAYPILHAYQSRVREKELSVALAVLDEALTILRYGLREEARPSALELQTARAAVGSYFETLPNQDVREAKDAPPVPTLAPLRAAGIPVVDDAEFAAAVARLDERRRLLLGNVRMDDRDWPPAGDDQEFVTE